MNNLNTVRRRLHSHFMTRVKNWVRRITCLSFLLFAKLAFADWQLIASNTVLGTVVPNTDLVVSKIQNNRVRVDMSSNLSVLFFDDKLEKIQLNHATKTFALLPVQANLSHPPVSPLVQPTPQQTTLNGQAAELYSWTNGVERYQTWVVPAARFLKGSSLLAAPKPSQANNQIVSSVGSTFGTNSIVVATAHSTIVPVSMSALNPLADSKTTTNLTITFTSTLLSIIETNFADADFQIPADYRDATGEAPPVFQMPTNILANQMIGTRNLEGLRKEFEKGRPVLIAPNLQSRP